MNAQVDAKQAKLNELYELGKSKGVLTYDEVINKLSAYEIDPEQFDVILETFEGMGIVVTRDGEMPPQQAEPEPEDLDLSVPEGVSIDDPGLCGEERLATILGTEGDGLSTATIADCDYTVRIPMTHGVDSLNVAAASAVAFWQLRPR